MSAARYECECGWVGTKDEMDSDSVAGGHDFDELWSNWICPGCNEWWSGLEDYQEVPDDVG